MTSAINRTDNLSLPDSSTTLIDPSNSSPRDTTTALALPPQTLRSMASYALDTTSRWVQRKTFTGNNAMIEALALGICLTDRLRLGKKFAVPWTSGTMRSRLTRIVQDHLEEYQALAGPRQVHSTTATSIGPPSLDPLSIEICARLAINDCVGSDAPVPIDNITASLGLRRLCDSPSLGRRIAYHESIAVGSTLPLITPSSPFHIAITAIDAGQCTLSTRGLPTRQACTGLVKLLPQKQITHRVASALLHPSRTRNPPPPVAGRITNFFPPSLPPTPLTQQINEPTDLPISITPSHPVLANPRRLTSAAPSIEYLSPHTHNTKWCTRKLTFKQANPGITMHLVPVLDHPDENKWEASLEATTEDALHDWTINWAQQCPCIRLSWDSNPVEVPGCHWINPTFPALSQLASCSNRTRSIMRTASSRHEFPSDIEIHNALRQTTDLALWVLHPTTSRPVPPETALHTIPAALELMDATHIISYPRGLLLIPPRCHEELEPWENHPIIQSLLSRIQSKWRTHQAQVSILPYAPKLQPLQATPAQSQAATQWLLTPQTVHIGPLRVCYRPSPIATYALLSSWQSILQKLRPDNISEWIGNWLHLHPSLYLEINQIPLPSESHWWWTDWLTSLTHSRIVGRIDECPDPHSPERAMDYLRCRMDVTDPTTQRLLQEHLEALLHVTPLHPVQSPSCANLATTIQALEDTTLLTHPPPLPLHLRRALLPRAAIWHWHQSPTGGASLQSTDAIQHAPFPPGTISALCNLVSSPSITHSLTYRCLHQQQGTSPLLVPHDVGSHIAARAIEQLINAIAKKFNDLVSLYNIVWDSNINSSSIASEAVPKDHPPRRHATKKVHKHDKRDP